MKKFISIILTSICIIRLVGCNSKHDINIKVPEKQSQEKMQNSINSNTQEKENEKNKEISSYEPVDLFKPYENPKNALEQALNDIYALKPVTDLSSYEIDLKKFENKLLKAKLNYNVEIFYVEYFKIDYEKKKVIYHYAFDKDRILSMKEKLNNKVNEFLNTINPSMTDLEKELAIHDYIIKNTSFDNKGFKNMDKIVISGSCYGTLVEGKAVCSGYSNAFNLLCKLSGLEAFTVCATGHAWNIVKVDEEYYQIDVLWDDTNVGDGIDYKYFNLSEEKMNETHSKFSHEGYAWINDIYPKCTSKKYDYLYNENNVVRDDEIKEVENLLP